MRRALRFGKTRALTAAAAACVRGGARDTRCGWGGRLRPTRARPRPAGVRAGGDRQAPDLHDRPGDRASGALGRDRRPAGDILDQHRPDARRQPTARGARLHEGHDGAAGRGQQLAVRRLRVRRCRQEDHESPVRHLSDEPDQPRLGRQPCGRLPVAVGGQWLRRLHARLARRRPAQGRLRQWPSHQSGDRSGVGEERMAGRQRGAGPGRPQRRFAGAGRWEQPARAEPHQPA